MCVEAYRHSKTQRNLLDFPTSQQPAVELDVGISYVVLRDNQIEIKPRFKMREKDAFQLKQGFPSDAYATHNGTLHS